MVKLTEADKILKNTYLYLVSDRKFAEKYSGNYDYYILTTSEKTTNIRVVDKDD